MGTNPADVSVLTSKKRISTLREHIERLRASQPPVSYDAIGAELGINKGVVWMLHNTDYKPGEAVRKRLGVVKDPRTRHRVNVDADTHARIKAEAERDGVSMGEVVKNRFVSR